MINSGSMVGTGMMGSGFIASIATLGTGIICQRYKFDMMHYSVIMQLIMGVLIYVSSITFDIKFLFGLSYSWIITDYAIWWKCLFGAIVVPLALRYCYQQYSSYKQTSNATHTIDIHSAEKVDRVLQYLQACKDVLGELYSASLGNSNLEFLYRKATAEGLRQIDYLCNHREVFMPLLGKVIPYCDVQIGIKGTLVLTHKVQDYVVDSVGSDGKPKESQRSVFLVSILFNVEENKHGLNPQQFFDEMNKRYMATLDTNTMVLYHKRMGRYITDGKPETRNKTDLYYQEKKESFETLEKMYIDPFFHPEKDRLWGLIKMIHTNPKLLISMGQAPRANFVLYGPPGAGKSSFPYRIAVVLQRHIYSVDIRDFSSIGDLIDVFTKPSITSTDPKDVVFILDEFDMSIEALYQIEQARAKEIEHIKKQIEHTYDLLKNSDVDYGGFIDEKFKLTPENDKKQPAKEKEEEEEKAEKDEKDEKKENSSESKKSDLSDSEQTEEKHVDDEKKKKSDAKGDKKSKSQQSNQQTQQKRKGKNTGGGGGGGRNNFNIQMDYVPVHHGTYDDYDDYGYGIGEFGVLRPRSNKMSVESLNRMLEFATEKAKRLAKEQPEISLKDLLSVFQGPVPRSGTLIFATTNEFDKIKAMCPALFRPSRMTPVFFGFCDRQTIIDIFKHFFKREPTFYVPEQTQNSSAEIVDYALQCFCLANRTDEEKFQRFDELVNKNIKHV